MSLIQQIGVLAAGALIIAGLALLWVWGASKNNDENCGMSCADCHNENCTKRTEQR